MSNEVLPIELPEIVAKYLAGDIDEVAESCRRSRRTIYRWMLSGLGEEKYRELVTDALVYRVADADKELHDARVSQDPVRVSAAREAARFARMDLERRRPGLYGPKQEVRHTAVPVLNIVLMDRPSGHGQAALPSVEPLNEVLDVTPVAVLTERVGHGVQER